MKAYKHKRSSELWVTSSKMASNPMENHLPNLPRYHDKLRKGFKDCTISSSLWIHIILNTPKILTTASSLRVSN